MNKRIRITKEWNPNSNGGAYFFRTAVLGEIIDVEEFSGKVHWSLKGVSTIVPEDCYVDVVENVLPIKNKTLEVEIYEISSFDYTSKQEVFVVGPKVENWEEYCIQFSEEMISIATKNNNSIEPIDWTHLNSALIGILKTKGYKQILFEKFSHFSEVGYVENKLMNADQVEKINRKNEAINDYNTKSNYNWNGLKNSVMIWDKVSY